MRKIRCFIAAIALLVTLAVPAIGSVANATSTVSARLTTPSASQSLAYRPYGQCPGGTSYDC